MARRNRANHAFAAIAGNEGVQFAVEQLVEKALRHAHTGYVIETGRVVAHGSARDLMSGDVLHQAYLGGPGAAS